MLMYYGSDQSQCSILTPQQSLFTSKASMPLNVHTVFRPKCRRVISWIARFGALACRRVSPWLGLGFCPPHTKAPVQIDQAGTLKTYLLV